MSEATRELRLLILEDSASDAELLERELRRGGLSFAARRVDTREAFIRQLGDFQPHLIISDYNLPSFDGLAALELVRQKSLLLPFILVSGHIGEDLAIEALKIGATDFLLKDRLGRLVSSVQRALREVEERSERQRLEERFRQVVESAPNAMLMINAAGCVEMVNAQAEKVFGYARTELLGQPIEMLIPERFGSLHPELRTSFFDAPQSRPMGAGRDLYGLRKDGSEVAVEIALNPIETREGKMVLAAIVDVSDRKARENRIQVAMKEKDLLLSEIHHRVKNNLQVICSLLDLQSSKVEDEIALKLLVESQNRIKSMALIHQKLYEAKDFARVDFSSFIDTLVPNLVSSYCVDPGRITLAIDSADVSLPIDAAIPCGLIINELISNALKHAFPNQRRGQITIQLANEPGGQIVLCVADNGIGIADELDLAGATLGLQLITHLADQLGGDLSIQRSNPTRFALRFSLEQ